jgi:transposase
MARRKEPSIPDAILDQLLAEADAKTEFDPGGQEIIMRNTPKGAAVYGVDIGKTRFDVVGLDAAGAVIERLKFRRETLLAFSAVAPKAHIGMEACPGSQWLARQLQAHGHRVSIIPAQFVKP